MTIKNDIPFAGPPITQTALFLTLPKSQMVRILPTLNLLDTSASAVHLLLRHHNFKDADHPGYLINAAYRSART